MRVYESRTRRPDTYPARLLRAFWSAIIPGLGQLAAGVKRRGFVLLATFLAVTGVGIWLLAQGTDTVLGYLVQPDVLLGLLWANLVLLLVRMFAVLDAWLTTKVGAVKAARKPVSTMLLSGAGLVLVLALTVAPHAVAGYYTYVSRDLLTSVFADGDGTSTSTTTTEGTPDSTSTSGGTATTRSTTTTTETTTTTVPLDWGDDGRMTVLLIGTDEGYGRRGARSDSMNVVTLNLETGDVAMFGLPRNTGNTPLGKKTAAALGMKTYPEMLNGLYHEALEHPEIAPDGNPGAEAIRETASLILGIPIDYYAVVNMLGLVDMVDALGGVDINLKQPMTITYFPLEEGGEKLTYNFAVGVNHLDGLEALAYARNRSDSDDYRRMARQRCVLMAMLYQKSVPTLTLRFPKIAAAIKKSLATDIPIAALPELIKLRNKLDTTEMITVGFTPPDWTSGYTEKRYNVLDFPKVQAAVDTILSDPAKWIAEHPPTAAGGAASDCWKIVK